MAGLTDSTRPTISQSGRLLSPEDAAHKPDRADAEQGQRGRLRDWRCRNRHAEKIVFDLGDRARRSPMCRARRRATRTPAWPIRCSPGWSRTCRTLASNSPCQSTPVPASAGSANVPLCGSYTLPPSGNTENVMYALITRLLSLLISNVTGVDTDASADAPVCAEERVIAHFTEHDRIDRRRRGDRHRQVAVGHARGRTRRIRSE